MVVIALTVSTVQPVRADGYTDFDQAAQILEFLVPDVRYEWGSNHGFVFAFPLHVGLADSGEKTALRLVVTGFVEPQLTLMNIKGGRILSGARLWFMPLEDKGLLLEGGGAVGSDGYAEFAGGGFTVAGGGDSGHLGALNLFYRYM